MPVDVEKMKECVAAIRSERLAHLKTHSYEEIAHVIDDAVGSIDMYKTIRDDAKDPESAEIFLTRVRADLLRLFGIS